jgi:signal peptidase II
VTEEAANERPPVLDVRVGSATDGLTPISVAERSLAATPAQWIGLLAVVAAAIGADQLTKSLIVSRTTVNTSTHVFGPLSLEYVQNSGIAFGLFASAMGVVIVLTVAAIAWMLAYFARSGSRHPMLPVALGLVIGGSASNLIDRVRLGHVTDFLKLTFTASFNLADLFILVGVAILLSALFGADQQPRGARSAPAPRP